MSDPVTSGDPSGASAATAGPATTAPSPGNSAPIGSFGTAKGSGLLRGKRPTPPAAPAASSAAPSGYQPSTIEVIRPQSEYKNPFTGETSVPSPARPEPVVSEPAVVKTESRPTPSPADITEALPPQPAAGKASYSPEPVAGLPAVASAKAGDLFPLEQSDSSRKAEPALPSVASAKEGAKAELNILPAEEVKRPAVSWGEHAHGQNGEPRARRDERPTFRPERRDGREGRPFEPREPRREPAAGERNSYPRDQQRDPRDQPRDFRRDERPAPVAVPEKKSGGFFGWLKSLFAEKPTPPEVRTGERDDAFRDGQGREGGHRHNRRRHRGGRGRGGFNGENRGPRDQQPRDPRDEAGPSSPDNGQSGEQRYEGGGGGRRRHRGGRGRYRDDRGGPRPEGQQGGGAI